MRYHPVLKALAVILSAVMVMVLCLSFLNFLFLLHANLYTEDMDTFVARLGDHRASSLADYLVTRYASENLSDVPPEVLSEVQSSWDQETLSERAHLTEGSWTYEIRDSQGQVLEYTALDTDGKATVFYNHSASYLVLAEPEESYDFRHTYLGTTYFFRYETSPQYQVSIYLDEGAITAAYGVSIETIRNLYTHRYNILAVMAISGMLFLACIVYLCFAAGRSHKREGIRPAGFNRIPLDLYALVFTPVCLWLCYAAYKLSPSYEMYYLPGNTLEDEHLLKLIISAVFTFSAGLMGTGFLFALAAQWKAPDRFWWRNSLICRLLRLAGKLLGRLLRLCIGLYKMLPVMWQWILTGCGMLFIVIASIFLESMPLFVLSLEICLAIVIYGAWSFGTLLKGARQMAQGSLHAKVSSKYLIGAFQSFAQQLNTLADVTVESANAKLRSERMKTELITNVSHDIKTPLTSIINYTDLLRTAETPEQREEYMQIIDRQSQRLKKLIEDLTEMSKASTGNLQANIAPMDASEALTQALGEFSDKLSFAQLQICPKIPQEPVMIAADGRLFWRVAANLMSNVVKYAQPGTRVYVELTKEGNAAVISVKNISRDPLNISAEELMERFVRGDESRNTEGSGLGLSIAASLMEVQKGSLYVRIDGDLFTATLRFPAIGE